MNKYVPLAGITAFVAALIYVSAGKDETSVEPMERPTLSSASLDSESSSSSLAEGSLATASQERSDTSTADTRYDAIEDTRSPMQNQLEDVARAYSDSARFPPYSQPLSENDWAALNPRAFTPSEKPLANAPSLQVSIELPQYVLDRSQDLPVKVVVANEGETANTSVLGVTGGQVIVRHGSGDSSPVPLASAAQTGNVETFLATIPAAQLATLPDAEITVAAQLTLSDGKSAVVTAVAKLYQSMANLTYLGSAYVDGAHLVIPANFDVLSPGYYRVQANLFSQDGIPVTHLNASFVLSGESAVGLLMAHATTLREKDIAGPYVLTDINVMRMPSAPGEQTGYGSTSQASYPVSGFPLTSYSDQPYEDPATQQRIKFLEALSDKGL